MSKIIIFYSTTDGHTKEICTHLKQTVEDHGHDVTLVSIDDYKNTVLKSFDKVVIGASIRYGKHSKALYEFVKTNAQILDQKPNAFFSVSLVARKPTKNQPDTNPYLKIFLKQISWKPKNLAVFAGKIDYPKYTFWDRTIIRLIMWITKGPTDPTVTRDFTDWQQVTEFGELVGKM